jgi:hypothetical protein
MDVGFFGRHCIMSERNGKIRKYRVSDEIRKNVLAEYRAIPEGGFVENYLHQKLAVVVLKFESLEEASDKVPHLHALCSVEIDD